MRERLLAKCADGIQFPACDHEDRWDGYSTMIEEVEEELKSHGGFDVIVCSIGSGGLSCGIMEGLNRRGRLKSNKGSGKPVNVLALETRGADTLNFVLNNGAWVGLPAVSRTTGSSDSEKVAEAAFEWAQILISCVVKDSNAARACMRFLDDEEFLVKAAYDSSLATAPGTRCMLFRLIMLLVKHLRISRSLYR